MGPRKIRFLVGKRQRGGHTLWYWQPSSALRKLGYMPLRLAERTNAEAEAIIEAIRLNAELDAERAGKRPLPRQPGTMPWLIDRYRTDPQFVALKQNTKRGYEQWFAIIEAWSARAGHEPIERLKPVHCAEFHRSMLTTPAKAAAVMRVLRLLLAYAVREGLIDRNPAERLRIKSQPPRQVVWSREHIEAFRRAASLSGRASLSLAIALAANLGQREGDILTLSWSAFDGRVMKLRQRKTGRVVEVPVTNELRAALSGAAEGRSSPVIVVSEATGKPYREDHFRHAFGALRRLVVEGDRARELSPIPDAAALQFRDLRRTAVVHLAEAGCTVPEIVAITGHDIEATARILETYMPSTSMMAENAITKLEGYRKRTKLEGSDR